MEETEKKEYLPNLISIDKAISDVNKMFIRKSRSDKYYQEFELYSIFSVTDIGPIFADLFSVFEGDIYKFEIIKTKIYKCVLKSSDNEIDLGFYSVTPISNVKFYVYSSLLKAYYTDSLLKNYPYINDYINCVVNFCFQKKVKPNKILLKQILRKYISYYSAKIKEYQDNLLVNKNEEKEKNL